MLATALPTVPRAGIDELGKPTPISRHQSNPPLRETENTTKLHGSFPNKLIQRRVTYPRDKASQGLIRNFFGSRSEFQHYHE